MTTLENIVTSVLIQKGYPVHWYLQCLKYAGDCYREMRMDTIGSVKSTVLTINEYGAAQLPCDYMDYVKVGIADGQFVRPLVQRRGLTRLNNRDGKQKIKHKESENSYNWYWYDGTNTNGEFIGGLYGHNVANQADTFKILKERNEIQLDERFQVDSIILEYISDSKEASPSTKVEPYAQAAIEAYIFWKLKTMNRAEGNGDREKMEYDNAIRIMRARMSGMTLNDIKRSVRKKQNL